MTSYVLRLYDDPLLRFDASYGEGLLAGKIERMSAGLMSRSARCCRFRWLRSRIMRS